MLTVTEPITLTLCPVVDLAFNLGGKIFNFIRVAAASDITETCAPQSIRAKTVLSFNIHSTKHTKIS